MNRIKKDILRFSGFFLVLIILLVIFAIQLVLIQIFRSDHLARLAEKQHNYIVEIEPVRGSVLDRKLRPLAFNVTVYSLYANPRAMTEQDKQEVIQQLSPLLKVNPSVLRDKLNKDRYFVWLQRKLPMELTKQIKSFGLKGIGFRKESKRFYPNKALAAHIVGFAGIDNEGLEGIELAFNKELKGSSGQMTILRDARQRELLIEHDFLPPQDGYHVVLTIDETIQFIAERALQKAIDKFKAKSASIIIMDVRTGEILALANRPTYNLDDVAQSSTASRTNRAISYVYEPGSVFKIVTAAAALEEERFKESDIIFCENGAYRIAGHTLTDHHGHGNLTFAQVIQKSSNIGTVKIAQKLGPDIIYKYADRFRFGKLTGIDLHGEVAGWLKDPSQWSKTTIGAIPIGYEVTVTPLQLVAAMAAIANEGVFMKPYVVKYIKDTHDEMIRSFEPQIVDRVVSRETALRLTNILIGVTEDGTASRARIKGIKVAGKTGTARKVENGHYVQGKYYASFAGFAPADNPRIAAVVVTDDPRPVYFGGSVSAPIFKEAVENTLKYLEN